MRRQVDGVVELVGKRHGRQRGKRLVIFVQHKGAESGGEVVFGRLGDHLEQAAFGGQIPLITAVVIQMLMGDVGHDGHVVIHGRHPMLGQPVRSRFQHAMGQPRLGHLV